MLEDIELKIKYYKERIVKEYIEKGIYPNNNLIQSRLNNIELRLSIFKSPQIIEGSLFNVEEFNKCLNEIYNDLTILYTLLYNITVLEYNELYNFINTHIQELSEISNMYLKRAELENYSTALGKTLIFKNKNFNININNNTTIIDLGELTLYDGMELVCIADINNANQEDIIFKLKENDTSNILACNSYTYNHDFLIIPGELKKEEYEITLDESLIINNIFELPIASTNTKIGNYITLAGKNKILYKKANKNGEIIEEKPIEINELIFDSHSYIDFYVINCTGIRFRFNKEPLSTNFNTSTNKIENLDYIHHFFIECDENFSFDFELDNGTVYALKENTIIDKDKFYFSGQIDVKDFLIINTMYNENTKKNYNITIDIKNSALEDNDINGIIVKKVR